MWRKHTAAKLGSPESGGIGGLHIPTESIPVASSTAMCSCPIPQLQPDLCLNTDSVSEGVDLVAVWKAVPLNSRADQTVGPDSFNCMTLISHFTSLVPHFVKGD